GAAGATRAATRRRGAREVACSAVGAIAGRAAGAGSRTGRARSVYCADDRRTCALHHVARGALTSARTITTVAVNAVAIATLGIGRARDAVVRPTRADRAGVIAVFARATARARTAHAV